MKQIFTEREKKKERTSINLGSLKDVLDENNPNKDSSRENNDTNLDEIIKRSPDEVHSNRRPNSNKSMSNDDDHIAHLLTNLLNLQTTMQNAEHPPVEDIQQYLQRIERSPIVQNDQDLQTVCHSISKKYIRIRFVYLSYYKKSKIFR